MRKEQKEKEEAKENEWRGKGEKGKKGKERHITSGSCLPMCDHMEHTRRHTQHISKAQSWRDVWCCLPRCLLLAAVDWWPGGS